MSSLRSAVEGRMQLLPLWPDEENSSSSGETVWVMRIHVNNGVFLVKNIVMTLANLDTGKLYSYADYLKWQIEERVELLKGKIFAMSPAPSTNHQIISGCVFYLLMNELKGKPCMVFSAPFDVRIGTGTDNDIFTVVQPDICVVCDRSKIDEKGCMGAPDIVLEILSPANNRKDLKNKYKIYEEAGVREYWVVSPQDHTFVVNTLQAGKFVASKTMVEGEVVYSAVLVGFSIDLSALFEQLL